MSAEARYFRVGLFVFVGLAAIAGTALVLGGRSFFAEKVTFETYFEESVQGLEVGSPVKLRGVGIHHDDQGAPPHRHLAEQPRGALRAGEVRDASDGAGESCNPFPLHRQPDLLADLRLRHRDAGGWVVRPTGTLL